MRRIILIAITLLTIHAYGQIDNIKANNVYFSNKFENEGNDTIPEVSYVNSTGSDRSPAHYINGKLVNETVLKTINPLLIDSVNVVKQDIEIEGKKYFGRIHIQMKKDYNPKLISLTDLKLKYTNLTNDSSVFMINDEFISGNYSKYIVDENYILKIIVEKISNKEENLHVNIVRLLTRTEENIIKSKEIILRAAVELLQEY
jgi:hypothetical protein